MLQTGSECKSTVGTPLAGSRKTFASTKHNAGITCPYETTYMAIRAISSTVAELLLIIAKFPVLHLGEFYCTTVQLRAESETRRVS